MGGGGTPRGVPKGQSGFDVTRLNVFFSSGSAYKPETTTVILTILFGQAVRPAFSSRGRPKRWCVGALPQRNSRAALSRLMLSTILARNNPQTSRWSTGKKPSSRESLNVLFPRRAPTQGLRPRYSPAWASDRRPPEPTTTRGSASPTPPRRGLMLQGRDCAQHFQRGCAS